LRPPVQTSRSRRSRGLDPDGRGPVPGRRR
jgi:hypothetical protein